MNILFLGPLPDPITGQSVACKVLLDQLVKDDDVEVVNLSKSGFKQGVTSVQRIVAVLGIVLKVWRRHRHADVVYFTISQSYAGNLKDLVIFLVCRRSLSKMVIHLHGGAGLRTIMSKGRVLPAVNRFFHKRLGGAIVLGKTHVDLFCESLEPARIHEVPNFAENYLFASRDDIDRKFASTAHLRVLFLSNLLPGKGHWELIEAYETLDPATKQAIAIDFAGGFESVRDERAFVARTAQSAGIRYHGIVNGGLKKDLYQRAHVFCLPTYYPYEGQPISILEAYASGCAVITTAHSGIGDVFAADVNGYEVATRSVDELRAALVRAVEAPERLQAMAGGNMEIARREYRSDVYSERVTRVLYDVALAYQRANPRIIGRQPSDRPAHRDSRRAW